MLYIVILFISLASSAVILFFALNNRHNPGALSLIIFGISLALAAGANFAIYRSALFNFFFWFAFIYLLVRICFTAVLTFTIEYTHNESLLNPTFYILLVLEPVATQILLWIDSGSKGLIPAFNLGNANTLFENPWFLETTIYTNLLLLSALLLLARDFSYKPLVYRYQTRFLLGGISASLLVNNSFSSSNYVTFQDLKIISLLAIGFAVLLGFRFAKLILVPPMSRDSVVEFMSDGWIVLDKKNNVIDINPVAEKIIGKTTHELFGQSAENIFKNWPNLINSLNESRALDVKGSVKIGGDWNYLNIYLSPLIDKNSEQYGKLIVWRDITERRIADEARQQARDEMFILLHSITSAAGRALNLDDFLQEIIYQIVYSSHSQSIAVYLLEDHENEPEKISYALAAQHGVPLFPDGKMFSIPDLYEVVTQVIEHGQTILIPDIQNDTRINEYIQTLGQMSLLVTPMVVEGEVLGLIGLTRLGNIGYDNGEIARLAAVTDEVASFIQSNRQRQFSIALAERQRLVRDLHDSVTQKLYGLVMLAEATRAGIKSGVTDMPARVIDTMAENARQALKEMRLFLFQMQPVDFARDGLAVVLQQRLSAVEGRADINARLVIDDKIILPLETQLALYFIAQEALNNVLKHAKAKNVKISLQTRRQNSVLEIEDDGCGFDIKATDTSGIGLRSMRERVAQIDGKLRLSSTPGTGTKITVTLKNFERPGDK